LFLDDTNILVTMENENTLEQKINRVRNKMQLWFDSKSYDKYWEGSSNINSAPGKRKFHWNHKSNLKI